MRMLLLLYKMHCFILTFLFHILCMNEHDTINRSTEISSNLVTTITTLERINYTRVESLWYRSGIWRKKYNLTSI